MNFLYKVILTTLLLFIVIYLIFIFLKPKQKKESFSEFLCSAIYNVQKSVFDNIQNEIKKGGPVNAISIYNGLPAVNLVLPIPSSTSFNVSDNVTVNVNFNSNKISIQNSKSTWDNLFLSTDINKDDSFTITVDPFSVSDLSIKNLSISNIQIQKINEFTYSLKDFKDCIVDTDFAGNNNIKIHLKQIFNIPFIILCDTNADYGGIFTENGFKDTIAANGSYTFDGEVVYTINYDQPNDTITFTDILISNTKSDAIEVNIDQDVTLKGLSNHLPESVRQKLIDTIKKQIYNVIQSFVNDEPFYNIFLKDLNLSINKVNDNLDLCGHINDTLSVITDILQNKLILYGNQIVNPYSFDDIPNLRTVSYDIKPLQINVGGQDIYIINKTTLFNRFFLSTDADGKSKVTLSFPIKQIISIQAVAKAPACSNTTLYIDGPVKLWSCYIINDKRYDCPNFPAGGPSGPVPANTPTCGSDKFLKPGAKLLNLEFSNLKCSDFQLNNEEKYFSNNMSVDLNLELLNPIFFQTVWEFQLTARTGYCVFNYNLFHPKCNHDPHKEPCPKDTMLLAKGPCSGFMVLKIDIPKITLNCSIDTVIDVINNKVEVKFKNIKIPDDWGIKVKTQDFQINHVTGGAGSFAAFIGNLFDESIASEIVGFVQPEINKMLTTTCEKLNTKLESNPQTYEYELPQSFHL